MEPSVIRLASLHVRRAEEDVQAPGVVEAALAEGGHDRVQLGRSG